MIAEADMILMMMMKDIEVNHQYTCILELKMKNNTTLNKRSYVCIDIAR